MNSHYINYLWLCFILQFFTFNHRAVADNPSTIDSLLFNIEFFSDTAQFNELLPAIQECIFSDPQHTGEQIKYALDLARRLNLPHFEGQLLLLAGISYDLRGFYDSAFMAFDQGLLIAERHNFDKLKGELYNNYSITLAIVGRLEESIGFALKAKDAFEEIGDSLQISRVYNNLGSRYAEIKYTDLALEYYLKAAEINQKLNDDKRLAYNYGNIGLIYSSIQDHEKALDYFTRSIDLLDTVNNRYDYSIALHNLANVHLGLTNLDVAMNYAERALSIARELNDDLGILSASIGMAEIYMKKGELQTALTLLNQSEPMAVRLGSPYYLMSLYENKGKIYASLQNFEQAFLYNQKFLSIKDSVLITERDKAVERVKDFENARKQQEILLLTKDAEIQRLKARRHKIIQNSVAIVGFLILLIAIGIYSRYRYVRRTKNELAEKNKIISYEKSRSDNLLLNILPAETAEELKNKGKSEARHFDMATVMFTDFKGFSKIAEELSAQELVTEIDNCYKEFDQIIAKHNVEKIKTIGDAYMCAGGLPIPNQTNPIDVVESALEIQQFMEIHKQAKLKENKPYFELRIGIHTGPVVAGIVGVNKFQYDIWGDTVNIAARMESSGEVGMVNVSQSTFEKIKDYFQCEHRGKVEAKNKGAIDMYYIISRI